MCQYTKVLYDYYVFLWTLTGLQGMASYLAKVLILFDILKLYDSCHLLKRIFEFIFVI